MTYREKMINALESVPVHDGVIRISEEVRDKIVELLKEQQEPVHAQKRGFVHIWFWCCGSCGVAITEGDKFCRMCGNGVKWDDQETQTETNTEDHTMPGMLAVEPDQHP